MKTYNLFKLTPLVTLLLLFSSCGGKGTLVEIVEE
jgi:hypothetical protein